MCFLFTCKVVILRYRFLAVRGNPGGGGEFVPGGTLQVPSPLPCGHSWVTATYQVALILPPEQVNKENEGGKGLGPGLETSLLTWAVLPGPGERRGGRPGISRPHLQSSLASHLVLGLSSLYCGPKWHAAEMFFLFPAIHTPYELRGSCNQSWIRWQWIYLTGIPVFATLSYSHLIKFFVVFRSRHTGEYDICMDSIAENLKILLSSEGSGGGGTIQQM